MRYLRVEPDGRIKFGPLEVLGDVRLKDSMACVYTQRKIYCPPELERLIRASPDSLDEIAQSLCIINIDNFLAHQGARNVIDDVR